MSIAASIFDNPFDPVEISWFNRDKWAILPRNSTVIPLFVYSTKGLQDDPHADMPVKTFMDWTISIIDVFQLQNSMPIMFEVPQWEGELFKRPVSQYLGTMRAAIIRLRNPDEVKLAGVLTFGFIFYTSDLIPRTA